MLVVAAGDVEPIRGLEMTDRRMRVNARGAESMIARDARCSSFPLAA
jgi:hypothetical protein